MRNPLKRPECSLVILLLAIALGLSVFAAPLQGQTASATDALVRVEVKGPIQALGLPIYAHLQDASGNDYALVIAPVERVSSTGAPFQVLDDPASPGAYYLARERREGARKAAAGLFTVLHDDGRRIIVKGDWAAAQRLSEMGFAVTRLPATPIILRAPKTSTAPEKVIAYDPAVAAMIDRVRQTDLYDDVGNLSGENAVTIGGSAYTIASRNTTKTTPIQKATQYVYERLTAMGLAVSYRDWSITDEGKHYSGRNVIAAKTGTTKPTEIVLMVAHLDDMPIDNIAPGADDNASGCAALLAAAKIMAFGSYERTLRFAFFTGEEQGLFGSAAYAATAATANENIVAVYNMDMIAWNSKDGPVVSLHTRPTGNPGYAGDLAIANTFSDVVTAYSLSSGLAPDIVADGDPDSDHSSFWNVGYAAIMAIEDDNDETPHYHRITDTRDSLNMTYFTNFTKASVGTVAHLALSSGAPQSATLAVTRTGSGKGKVTSIPTGINCGNTCTNSFESGAVITLTATANSGSAFSGWTGCPSASGTSCSIALTSDLTVTASFAPASILTVSIVKVAKGGGTVRSEDLSINCPTLCKNSYPKDTSVTLSALADEASKSNFTGWRPASLLCADTGPCTISMNKAKVAQAVFVGPQKLTLVKQKIKKGNGTITSSPEGITCGPSCNSTSAMFSLHQDVVLTAVPAEGSTLTRWLPASLGCSGTSCTIAMDRTATAKAVFTGGVAAAGDRSIQEQNSGAGK
jgi:hypothetical protein